MAANIQYANLVDLGESFPIPIPTSSFDSYLLTFTNLVHANIGVVTAENEPLEVGDPAAWENTESVVSRLLKADLARR